MAGQAPDQASREWPGRCWRHQRQVINKTRRKGGQAREESPSATRHQPWPAPAITAGTDMPRLTGTLMARDLPGTARAARAAARRVVGLTAYHDGVSGIDDLSQWLGEFCAMGVHRTGTDVDRRTIGWSADTFSGLGAA